MDIEIKEIVKQERLDPENVVDKTSFLVYLDGHLIIECFNDYWVAWVVDKLKKEHEQDE